MKKESNAPQGQDSTRDHRNNAQDSGALGNALPAEGGHPPPPPEHNSANDHSNHTPWWKDRHFALQILLFFVGLYVAHIYSGQLNQMIESNKITHDALILGQRPWVGVNVPQITKYQYVPNTGYVEFSISFGIKNFGVSPALHVIPGRDVRGGDATLEELENGLSSKCAFDTAMTESQMVKGGSGYTLFPSTPHIEEWKIAMSKGSYDLKKPMYVLACVTYKDQFSDTHTHHTPVCYHTKGTIENINVPEDLEPCFWGHNAD